MSIIFDTLRNIANKQLPLIKAIISIKSAEVGEEKLFLYHPKAPRNIVRNQDVNNCDAIKIIISFT